MHVAVSVEGAGAEFVSQTQSGFCDCLADTGQLELGKSLLPRVLEPHGGLGGDGEEPFSLASAVADGSREGSESDWDLGEEEEESA